MRLKIEDYKLTGGNELELEVTEELLRKYVHTPFDFDDFDESDIDNLVGELTRELHLDNGYGGDEAVFTLAVIMECLNVKVVDGCTAYQDIEVYLNENTPFHSTLSGFVMFILCQLEECKLIHDTKYCELTEKGKVLLWLLRQFTFCGDKIEQ